MPPGSTMTRPDEAKAESAGDRTIETLFEALESPLLAYALRLVGDRDAAEDLVQEAFMKLHAQFQTVREPRLWLYRTVHNQALNHRRQSNKVVSLHPLVDGDPGDDTEHETTDPQLLPDEQVARWEGIGLVRLTLATLDERSRELIRLKFTDNLSYKEIADRTGLTAGHVGYLLHHAIKTVGEELAKTGVKP
jgi:RNA polymerase sigma factor (sigma-70 family)